MVQAPSADKIAIARVWRAAAGKRIVARASGRLMVSRTSSLPTLAHPTRAVHLGRGLARIRHMMPQAIAGREKASQNQGAAGTMGRARVRPEVRRRLPGGR